MTDYLDDHFWSAVKRKQVTEMLEVFFTAGDCPKAAEVAGSVTRLTDASITRMKDALKEDLDGEVAVEEEPTEDEPEPMMEDDTEGMLSVSEIRGLVATGKKKKIKIAKKAFKAQFKKTHPEYAGLKELFKK